MRNVGGVADRGLHQREVLGTVVVQDQEAVLAPDHGVLDGVLHQVAALPHGGELGRPGRAAST